MSIAITRLLLVLWGASVLAWGARPGDFQVIGPGGGGAMFNPTVSPHDVNTVLISCDMTGGYITHNGGASWRMFNLRGAVHFFVFDPRDPHTMYAEATGLWRSTDDGETWRLIYPKPSSMSGVRMDSDHADEVIVADANPMGDITAMAVDPGDSKTLYVAAYVAAKPPAGASLYVSRDGGASWTSSGSLPEASMYLTHMTHITHIWVNPRSSPAARTLAFGGPHGVEFRGAGKTRSVPAPAGTTFTDLSAGFDESGKIRIYATSTAGLYVSGDAASWKPCALPGSGTAVQAVAANLHHPEVAYVSYSRLSLDGDTWSGVARTSDGGRTWNLVWKESKQAAPNVHDAWITERFGPGWGENPLMLAVAGQDPNLCYGTDLGRTMLTTDGGKNWRALYSRRVPNGAWTSTGLDVTTNYGMHFDPFDGKRQFITYTDIGLFRSEDGGNSWMSSTQGVPEKWVNTTYWVEFDPKVRGRMWSVNSGTHDLPRPKMWRRNSVLKFKGGVCVSADGGRTWTKSNIGMEETAPTHILLDPDSPVNARVLYVAAFGRGVYKSIDGGKTWVLKNKGIQQSEPFAWRLARAGNGTLYLLLARRSEDGNMGNIGDGALYRSIDRGDSWTAIDLPAGANAPNGLAIDPDDPQRLYLATWARAAGMHGEGGGIYVSGDAGRAWRQVLDRDRHVYDVTVDPRKPATLYAAGFESSAWKSADRGEHWTRIAGFNFKWGQRVIADPADADKIYITTFGGSVWHGSANGKESALDIATPELAPGR